MSIAIMIFGIFIFKGRYLLQHGALYTLSAIAASLLLGLSNGRGARRDNLVHDSKQHNLESN